GKLFKEAGFPDGVVNILPGSGSDAGEAIITHPDVNKVSFTGSTEVGKNVMRQAADQVKSVTLELGGKSPGIILNDAELEETIEGTLSGTMYNHGQNCSAVTRIYVQRDIYEEVLAGLKERAEKIRLGSGMDENTDMGPLVSKKQQHTVMNFIEKGKEEGARLITGGNAPSGKGFFVEPTIFADVKDDMTIVREEIFGPVMAVMPFDTVDEAISRANDSEYGLGASEWTQNIKLGRYLMIEWEAATGWI